MPTAGYRRVFTMLVAFAVFFVPFAASASELTFSIATPMEKISVRGTGDGSIVSIADGQHELAADPGAPRIPFRVVSVLLPQGEAVADWSVTVGTSVVIAEGTTIPNARERLDENGRAGSGPTFFEPVSGAGAFPQTAGRYLGTGMLHGYAIASFAVYPLVLDGDRVSAWDQVTIHVTTEVDGDYRTAPRRFRDGFRERVRREVGALIVNPAGLSGYSFSEIKVPGVRGFQPTSFPSLEGSPVDYVIVTPDSLAAAYQPLADWKSEKGVPTVIRTTEWIEANYRNGSDLPETIRNFIIDAYQKWGITYVLLGGDTEQIPARLLLSNYHDGGRELPCSIYFGGLDGDFNADHDDNFGEVPADDPDLYVEVYAGRMPTRDVGEVAVAINKIMTYETPGDRDYTTRAMFMAEVLFPQPWDGMEPISQNGATNAEFLRVSYFTDPDLELARLYETYWLFPGSVDETRQACLDTLDTGYNHAIHIGHGFRFNMSVGDASILNADALSLTNGDRLTNLYMLNCAAAAYNYQCLGENFLRNPNGGAVSIVGANESAFPGASNNYMSEYYRLVMNEDVVHIGEAFHRSRIPRTPLALMGDNIDLWTHYIYCSLADPEMPMWTDTVDTLQVSHTAGVGLGTTNITVTVLDGMGSPVDSSMVCLSKGDDDYQVGTTDGAGQVTLSFRAESAGTIKVVATGLNHARHESSITVSAGGGAYVSYAGMAVDDDNSGGTSGNGDGVIDAGETIDLLFSVENSGGSATGNVDLVLRSNTFGVTVSDSLASVGVVGGSSTVPAGDAFRVSFASSMSDESVAEFDLIVKDTGVETWSDEVKREVHAPQLGLVGLRIDDTATGNSDGVVDAGETFRLYYEIKNFGTGASTNLTATIIDMDNGFVFFDSLDTFPALATITSGENSGGFQLMEPSLAGLHRVRMVAVDLYGRAYQDTMELRPPVPPDSLAVDPSFGPTQLQVTWTMSGSLDVTHYNVYRSTSPGGPYTKANADPVRHTLFSDRGLSSTTTYYYVVAAVDVSGNESLVSPEFFGSTNPAQATGFPIVLGVETTSSPVVGDIDGDGDLEVVQGADYVYAWHHDGVEILDGDGNAQSWGVLHAEGTSYVSPIALARIDGLPGLDIICASRDSMTVTVLNHLGEHLPGWPQPVLNTIRAGLSVGDLDGDNLLEIIAIDEKGRLYVWNHDGTEWVDGDSNPGTSGVFKILPGASFHYCTPALADIDNDNSDEIILGTQADSLYALNGDGSAVPGWPVWLGADISGAAAVGDVDDDGDLEIVVNTGGGMVAAYHHNGTVLWARFLTNGLFFAPSPAIGDVTGDGRLETFIPTSDGDLYAITHTGADLAGWPVEYSSYTTTESSPIIVDIDGDGNEDIILGDETQFIHAWDAAGVPVDGFPLGTEDAMRSVPAADDIDGDGDVDLVAAGWDANVYVWDFPGLYDPDAAPWPQFHANVHNDGLVGRVIPTGVLDVAFAYDVVGESVDLRWYLPPPAGYLFEILRAPVTNDRPGEFRVLARDVAVGADGALHYADRDVRAGDRFVYRIEETGGEGEYETPAVYVPVRSAGMTQNYPNPFNPVTRITYWVPEGAGQRVELVVYDVRGARVRTLVGGAVVGGRHEVVWDGRNDQGQRVGSGVYFYRMVQKRFTATRKMLLLK